MSTDENSVNPLLDAVDLLTKPRNIVTVIKDDTGSWLDIHQEQHPPLLQLLLDGTGISQGAKTSEQRIPIDADALEMWAQIRDLVRLWCTQLDATYLADNLMSSVRNWYLAHSNAVRGNRLGRGTDHDVTRMVEGWVRMIEKKFDPDEKKEWVDPCPAWIPTRNIDGDEIGYRRCGARRIVVKGEERFAIQLNWTIQTAECGRCHSKWEGILQLRTLRYQTALYNLERADTEKDRRVALEDLTRLQGGDTPKAQIA